MIDIAIGLLTVFIGFLACLWLMYLSWSISAFLLRAVFGSKKEAEVTTRTANVRAVPAPEKEAAPLRGGVLYHVRKSMPLPGVGLVGWIVWSATAVLVMNLREGDWLGVAIGIGAAMSLTTAWRLVSTYTGPAVQAEPSDTQEPLKSVVTDINPRA